MRVLFPLVGIVLWWAILIPPGIALLKEKQSSRLLPRSRRFLGEQEEGVEERERERPPPPSQHRTMTEAAEKIWRKKFRRGMVIAASNITTPKVDTSVFVSARVHDIQLLFQGDPIGPLAWMGADIATSIPEGKVVVVVVVVVGGGVAVLLLIADNFSNQ